MRAPRQLRYLLLIMILLIVAIAGCSVKNNKSKETNFLKIGLMPAVDSAPILLAEKKGYFEELGIEVELEIYTNPQNRQSALQSQTIDGAMTDLIAVTTNVEGGFEIKATMMTNGVFPVLSVAGSEDIKSIKVGMMEISVSNFLIDEWLADSYNIEKVFITEIPARLAAISNGQLDMGLFPEPVASVGELNGLKKTLYETEDDYCPDVIVFTKKALESKEEAIIKFYEAYNKAVADINVNEQEARNIIMEKIPNLKPEVRDMIVLPIYTEASLPDDQYINKIIDWTAGVLNKTLNVKVDDLVERKFVK